MTEPVENIWGLTVAHSAIFAALISALTIAIGFMLHHYSNIVSENIKSKYAKSYIIIHLGIVEKRISEQIIYLEKFKDQLGKPGAKFTIAPMIDFDFSSNRESMSNLIYTRLLMNKENKSKLHYRIDKYIRATEKTWNVLEEMVELIRIIRAKDSKSFIDSELDFKLSLFRLDHSTQTKDTSLNKFFTYHNELPQDGLYDIKFKNYYKKMKDYCLANGDIRFGDILASYFKIEAAFDYLKSFDNQFQDMINNKIADLKLIKEELSTAKIDLFNSKVKWLIIP